MRNMFVPSMYVEFKKHALEDAAAGYNYGMECLFRFYRFGLSFLLDIHYSFSLFCARLIVLAEQFGFNFKINFQLWLGEGIQKGSL